MIPAGRAFVLGSSNQVNGWTRCWEPLWKNIADMVKMHRVTFIGGDFNLALFTAKGAMRKEGVEATFLGSWAWRHIDGDTHGSGEGIPG